MNKAGVRPINELISGFKTLGNDNLYFLFGDEDYHIDRVIATFVKRFINESGLQTDYIKIDCNGKEVDFDTLRENLMSPPWFSEKKIVLVKDSNIFSVEDPKKEFQKKLEDLFESLNSSVLLIFCDQKINNRKKSLISLFDEYGSLYESKILRPDEIGGLISKTLSKYNLTITSEASSGLIMRNVKSLRPILNDLTKIRLYCTANQVNVVDINVINELCSPDINATVFNILDSVAEGRTDAAYLQLEKAILFKEKIGKIRVMFAKHLKQLICAKEIRDKYELMQKIGVPDFAASKLISQAGKFSLDSLTNLYDQYVKYDFDIKQGKMDERTSFECLIALAALSFR